MAANIGTAVFNKGKEVDDKYHIIDKTKVRAGGCGAAGVPAVPAVCIVPIVLACAHCAWLRACLQAR